MHPENCQPCHLKQSQSLSATGIFFFFLHLPRLCTNKSLVLVVAEGHTGPSDRCYQIVTETTLKSPGLQVLRKVF